MDDKGHADRYAELPEYTREFFERLTPEKIATIEEGIKLTDNVKTVGRFWKWTMITAAAVFSSVVGILQGLEWLFNKWKG